MAPQAVFSLLLLLCVVTLTSSTTSNTTQTEHRGATTTRPAQPLLNQTQKNGTSNRSTPPSTSVTKSYRKQTDFSTALPHSNANPVVSTESPGKMSSSSTTSREQLTVKVTSSGYDLSVTTNNPQEAVSQSKQEVVATTTTANEQMGSSTSVRNELLTPDQTTQSPEQFTTTEYEVTTSGVDIYPCGAVSFRQKFVTGCSVCYVTRSFGCPPGYKFLRERACSLANFCLYECEVKLSYPQCCPGRSGPDCQPCPGGVTALSDGTGTVANLTAEVTNVCSDHGVCSEGLKGDGSCSCQKGFAGFACERCAGPDLYGEGCNRTCECVNGTCDAGTTGSGRCDCDLGYQGELCDELAPCNNSLCGENAQCHSEHGQTCVCLRGYIGDGQNCTMQEMCQDGSAKCHTDAICNMTGPAEYTCTCKSGYAGDGFACRAIDPCQDVDNPVCPTNSTACEYKGPGKHKCKCLPGFANLTKGAGCIMRDLCLEKAHSCNKHANCTMKGPNEYECTCLEGFVGNGYLCKGNILQVLDDLNSQGKFKNSLNSVRTLYQFALGEFLESAQYLTVFVPTDEAFRQHDWRPWMNDWATASQTVKHHILPVPRSLNELVNGSLFYTLEGTAAEITYSRRKKAVRYRLLKHSTNTKAKILRGNIAASNGIIHVMNKLMNKPPVIGYKKRQTLYTQIQQDGRYNRLDTLLSFAGLRELLNSTANNMTVFAPNNKAWDNMEDGALTFLQAPEGKAKLISLLKNHIVMGNHFSFDMLGRRRMTTLSNNIIELNVSRDGKLLLNGEENGISQTDIPALNGLYHHINDVLIPESIRPILNRRCDVQQELTVRGVCGLCTFTPRCGLPSDEMLPEGRSRCLMLRTAQGYVYHL